MTIARRLFGARFCGYRARGGGRGRPRHALRHGCLALAAAAWLAGCQTLPDEASADRPGAGEDASARAGQTGSREIGEAGAMPQTKSRAGEQAQDSADPETPDFYQPGTDVFTARPEPTPAVTDGSGDITLNFEKAPIAEVVKVIVGDMLDRNYVIDPRVQGTATFQTSRPIGRDALLPTLELLLRMNGAALVAKDDVYHVVPRDAAVRNADVPQLGDRQSPLPQGFGVRIAPLEHIAAAEMKKILEPFTHPGNIVRADESRNLLILAGSSQELSGLLETIRVFDVDWLEGMSVGLFTPEFVDAEDLVDELGKLFGENADTPMSGLVRLITIKRLNAVLAVTPRRSYLEKVSSWVERLDRSAPAAGRRLFVYRVENMKAADIADVLNRIYGDEADGQSMISRPEIAPGREPVMIQTERSQPRQGGMQQSQRGTEQSQRDTQRPENEGQGEGSESASSAGESSAPPGASSTGPDRAAAGPVTTRQALSTPENASAAQGGLDIGEAGPVRIIADEANNALVIMATAKQYDQIRRVLRRLDQVPLQVLVEVTIAEVSLTDELRYGLEWFFRNGLDGHEGQGTLDLGSAGLAGIVPGFSYTVTNRAGEVRGVLNALASESRLNVLSSPSLMVLNNQTADIQVGDEVPVVTQQQQAAQAQSSLVNTVEFRETGVLLSVTPRVNPGGLVNMEISQEVSNVAPGSGDDLTPTIQQRSIASSVAVQSGETVVLGGLIRENTSEQEAGVPFLYRLPLIGRLFGQRSTNQERTELVALITPRVVQNASEARAITEEFRDRVDSLKSLYEQSRQ